MSEPEAVVQTLAQVIDHKRPGSRLEAPQVGGFGFGMWLSSGLSLVLTTRQTPSS